VPGSGSIDMKKKDKEPHFRSEKTLPAKPDQSPNLCVCRSTNIKRREDVILQIPETDYLVLNKDVMEQKRVIPCLA